MTKDNNEVGGSVLVIRFSYTLSQKQLEQAAQDFVENVQPTIEGLRWKIFLNDTENKRSGGIYLFRDTDSAIRYTQSAYAQRLMKAPGLGDFSAEIFGTMHEASVKTGAPLEPRAARGRAVSE